LPPVKKTPNRPRRSRPTHSRRNDPQRYYDTAEERLKKYAGDKISGKLALASHFQKAGELIPQFEEETGIDVEVEFIDYVSLHDKQVLEMSKPQGDYDVVAWTIFWKNEYVNKGLLAPLSQFFGDPTLVMPGYDPDDLVKSYLISGSAVGGKKGLSGRRYPGGVRRAVWGGDLDPGLPQGHL
jgi:hypothetical protein